MHVTCRFPLPAPTKSAADNPEFDDDRRFAATDVAIDRAIEIGVGKLVQLLRSWCLAALARFVARGRGTIGGLPRLGIEGRHIADWLGSRDQGSKNEEHEQSPFA